LQSKRLHHVLDRKWPRTRKESRTEVQSDQLAVHTCQETVKPHKQIKGGIKRLGKEPKVGRKEMN
jgi:hypothetical protein